MGDLRRTLFAFTQRAVINTSVMRMLRALKVEEPAALSPACLARRYLELSARARVRIKAPPHDCVRDLLHANFYPVVHGALHMATYIISILLLFPFSCVTVFLLSLA